MKRLLFLLAFALLPAFASAQNIRVDGIVQGRFGLPQGGAHIAVCTQPPTANTTTVPCAPLAALCSSLTDLSCTSPNPIQADGLGNYHFYIKIFPSAAYSLQFYGAGLSTKVLPDQTFGGGGGGSSGNATFLQGVPISTNSPSDGNILTYSATLGMWVPLPGGGGGGSWPTTSMPVGSGSALFPNGTGQVQSNFFIPATFSGTSPGTLDFTGASSQTPALSPFAFAPLQNGHFAEWIAMDESVTAPPGTVAGTPEFVFRTWFNSTGIKMPGNKNRFLGVYFSPNTGGITSSSSQQSSAFAVTWDNTAVSGLTQDYNQEQAAYSDFLLNGPNANFHGHSVGEVDAGNWRGSFNDNRSAVPGTAPSRFATISAQMTRQNAAAMMQSSEGKWINFSAYMSNQATGSLLGTMNFVNYYSIGGDFGPCTGSGCTFYGFRSNPPNPRFASANYGFECDGADPSSNDYCFYSSGVNSAGSASGFNAFTGPSSFGTGVHAATGFQIDVLGTVKLKAGAGANDLCFFGSTSGSVCLSAAAAAGSVNFTLPTADGLNGYSLVTDGSGHLSFANITGGGGGCSGTCITSINSQTGPILTLNTNNAGSNVALTITNSSSNVLTWSAAVTGRIPIANLDTQVFAACTTSTKISCTPGTQTFALALSSPWAAADLNANVVQAVTNDTNLCASIGSGPTAQTLILGWLGSTGCNSGTPVPLTVARGGNGLGSFSANQILVGTAANTFTATTLTNGILSYNTTTHLFSTGSALSNPMTTLGDMIYSSDGSGTPARLAGPTTPNGVAYTLCSTPSGSAAAAPAWCLGGVTGRTVTGTTDTIVATDRTAWVTYTNNSSTVAVTLPQAGSTGFTSNYSFRSIVQGSSPVTFTTTTSTFNGSGSTFTQNQGENCLISSIDGSNWVTACSPGQLVAGTGIGFTRTLAGITISANSIGTPSRVTNQSTSQTSVTIGSALTAGGYSIHYYANVNTACSTGGNTVSFTFTWVDPGGTRTLQTGSLSLAAGAPASSAYLSGIFPIEVGSSNVTYTSTISGSCATGTSSYDVRAFVAP